MSSRIRLDTQAHVTRSPKPPLFDQPNFRTAPSWIRHGTFSSCFRSARSVPRTPLPSDASICIGRSRNRRPRSASGMREQSAAGKRAEVATTSPLEDGRLDSGLPDFPIVRRLPRGRVGVAPVREGLIRRPSPELRSCPPTQLRCQRTSTGIHWQLVRGALEVAQKVHWTLLVKSAHM